MSASALAIDRPSPEVCPAFLAWSIAIGSGLVLIGAGLVSSMPLPVFGWAAAFLLFAVASDVRFRRIPNWLTLPALLAALLASPWFGATSGPVEAAAGAALALLLLVGPYALGGIGAGDVKALMVLGAWLGPEAVLGVTAWALIAGGALGLIALVWRGEIVAYARRWGRAFSKMSSSQRIGDEPAAAGSTSAGGIPFAVAIAVGLAAQWYGGSPW
ncbi:MAG: prepilin peptidase [Deltaproteobacteria bacterium]|jgi:prepilin peptidase CpaA|nr:prepilin peptidase [Deltaproteobacteria bacterium]